MKPSRKGSRAHDWWQRALVDGKHCEQKRRERYYEEYLAQAEQSLLPGPLSGPFSLLYRMGFRLGYDNSKEARERGLLPFKRRARKA